MKKKDSTAAVAAGGSGIVTAAAVVRVVSVGGKVIGLGGPGITAGLASLGGAVCGGGMLAGLVTVAAAPIAVTAVTYGAVKAVQGLCGRNNINSMKKHKIYDLRESTRTEFRKNHPAFPTY